ncbi:Protein disulfide-isomerase-like 2-2 [Ascosphaera pollenicola]|nr:Protein disulfide-isomerase-like 2-2 [Ascosphaera pollenicola]
MPAITRSSKGKQPATKDHDDPLNNGQAAKDRDGDAVMNDEPTNNNPQDGDDIVMIDKHDDGQPESSATAAARQIAEQNEGETLIFPQQLDPKDLDEHGNFHEDVHFVAEEDHEFEQLLLEQE